MVKWANLERDVTKWLSSFVSDDIMYKKGIGYLRFMSDGILIKNNRLLAVEIECGQTHPDTNVLKYWRLQSNDPPKYKKLVLLHFFTPGYRYPGRKELAMFLSKNIPSRAKITYLQKDFPINAEYKHTLREVKSIIHARMKRDII